MKAVEVRKAVAGVLALRNLKSRGRRTQDDDFLLDPSEISSLVTAYQRERPLVALGSTVLH